jgi:hypothetical protein
VAITLKNLYSDLVIQSKTVVKPGTADPPTPAHIVVGPVVADSHRLIAAGVVLFLSLWPFPMASATGQELSHVLGIVTAIDAKHIEVKTAKGSIVSVLLNKQVRYKNKSNPKSTDPPAVGDRVIIEASKDDKTKKVAATVVHYSPVKSVAPQQ